MKAIKVILFLLIIRLTISCENEKAFNVIIESINVPDSIVVSDLVMDIEIAKLSDQNKIKIPLKYPTVGEIKIPSSKSSYLTILRPNNKTTIKVLRDSIITTNNRSDSLINDLSKSTLDFINSNLDYIFTAKNPDSVVKILNDYRLKRKSLIAAFGKDLNVEETEVLNYYNEARIYGFLLFYGMVPKKLNVENSFYDFVENIGDPKQTLKIAPYIYLYKYKVEYLRKNKSLEKVSDFLDFLEKKTKNKDLSDFLKVYCLKELIESSPYWENNRDLLNAQLLNQIIAKEKDNNYYNLLKGYSNKFFLTQKGELAFDFKAEKVDSSIMRLGDFKGKVVFIDTWATWCGPCLEDRPKVLQIAEKFKKNPDLEVLMVSVDTSKKKWLNFISDHSENIITNVFIKDGMTEDFGREYNITAIPKYILINKKGLIVNAYLKHPSKEVERLIEEELIK